METMLIAGTLFQAVGQIQAGETAAANYKAQAEIVEVQSASSIALEKASAAERTLDRLRVLRQITGDMLAKGSAAGIDAGSGTIGTLVSDSQSQYGREQGISDFNLRQTVSSIKTSALSEVSSLKASATSARKAGYLNAAGTLMNYGMAEYQRSGVPDIEDMSGQSSGYSPYKSAPRAKPIRVV